MQTHRKAPKGQTGLYLGFESNFCFFLHALLWASRTIKWGDQTTEQVTFTSGVWRMLWASGRIQAEPCEVSNNAASRLFFGIPLFKVSELMF